MTNCRLTVLLALGLWGFFCSAEEAKKEPLPGHSMHGEAFDEGPRQFATLMRGMGDVHLEVTTKSTDAQNSSIKVSPNCMAFGISGRTLFPASSVSRCGLCDGVLGMAMANINNPKRAGQLIKEATKRRTKPARASSDGSTVGRLLQRKGRR
jgi:hypothetical protein